MSDPVAHLVPAACNGDADALDQLVRGVKDRVYTLAMRVLWHPEDAEDATQEILLKVVTGLSTFRGESRFPTWVMRIATNHLLNVRRSRVERERWTFPRLADDLMDGLDAVAPATDSPDQALLEREVKLGCTQAMLQCLDRNHRVAYVLGEVFRLPAAEAGAILDISPAAFRQRLSRARRAIRAFLDETCGLVKPASSCHCRRRIKPAIAAGRLTPDRLLFASHPRVDPSAVETAAAEMEGLEALAGIFETHTDYRAPEAATKAIRDLITPTE